MEERRDSSIDLIKTVAMFGVLLIHVSNQALRAADPGSAGWWAALVWSGLPRGAVPLFFMCTGALFLPSDRLCSLRHLFTRSLPRVAAALFFWAFLYLLCPHVLHGDLSPQVWGQIFTDLLLFRHEGHFYYLHITLLVYVCLPVLRAFVRAAGRRQLWYAVGVWFLLGVLLPTVTPFAPFNQLMGIPVQAVMNLTWSSLGYVLLGYVLRTAPLQRRWVWPLLWGLGAVGSIAGTGAYSLAAGALNDHFWLGTSLPCALLAAGTFGTLLQLKLSPRGQRLTLWISKASFCVYLVHMEVLYVLVALGVTAANHPLWAPPLLTVGVFAVCFVVWLVLRLIPGVRRWLI